MPDDATPPNLSSIARAVEPPPEDFDALTAPTEQLLRHGLPRRPDPEREPSLAKIWAHVLARPIRFARAELEIDPVMTARARTRASKSDFSIGDWAGVAIDTTKVGNGEPAIMVFAEWVVPTVLPLGPAGFSTAFWVGIDGLFGAGGQILQAGIAAELDVGVFGSDINYWAWTEWFRNDAVQASSFPVGPGDSVSFLVCAPQPDQGYVTMINLSQGVGTTVQVFPPGSVTSLGASVEWVVEQTSDWFPYFYAVRFNDCAAATQSTLLDLEPNGTPLAITDIRTFPFRTTTLAQGSIECPTVAAVRWEAFTD